MPDRAEIWFGENLVRGVSADWFDELDSEGQRFCEDRGTASGCGTRYGWLGSSGWRNKNGPPNISFGGPQN